MFYDGPILAAPDGSSRGLVAANIGREMGVAMTQNRHRRPPQPHSDRRTAVSLMARLLLSPDFTREETEGLAEKILRRHGIGVTGARVAARFARSLPSQPRPGAGPVETKYMRLWPFWLSAHLIARARRIEETYETYYVDSDPGRTLALSVALKTEQPNLEQFCAATRRQVARARAIDQGRRLPRS